MIFVPSITSPAKVGRIRSSGAKLVVGGEGYADVLAASEAYVATTGALAIDAFEQVETLLGQGTLGLAMEADVPDADTVPVAVGGGGLIGGIAAWYGGRAKIVSVRPDAAPTLHAAFAAGGPVDAVSDDDIRRAQAAIWFVLGVVAEPGGAVAFAALLSGRDRPHRNERALVLICGSKATPLPQVRRPCTRSRIGLVATFRTLSQPVPNG